MGWVFTELKGPFQRTHSKGYNDPNIINTPDNVLFCDFLNDRPTELLEHPWVPILLLLQFVGYDLRTCTFFKQEDLYLL